MSKPESRRFPVTVTRLPVPRCRAGRRTVAYLSSSLSKVRTGHYLRAHIEPARLPSGNRPRRPGANRAVPIGIGPRDDLATVQPR